MSFCFNFDVPGQTTNVDGNELQNSKTENAAKAIEKKTTPAEPVKEAKEHPPPSDPQFSLMDAVAETVTIGTLPPLYFLNETVFEKTASERDDGEKILSRTATQRSDLISGVYEGGLKVWECTYDLLELIEKEGETFGGKAVLDLGCGAGLLGILALKRGARLIHFQDYNSTVIEQLTVPNVMLNCQEDDDVDSEDDKEGKGKGVCKTKAEEKREVKDGSPPTKKKAVDPSQQPLLAKCRFYSGDWSTFLALVKKEEPQPKYDIIFTSETIYNTAYYPTLHDTLHKLLAPGGLVYLATKSHYFGVGGGLHLFETFVKQRGVFSLDRLWDGEDGLQRHVVENQKLREQNDELNGQILSLSLYEAKTLFATQTKAQSLAAEIDNASRDQLMEALKEQEEINIRLRQYMDKIILSILDHNPSILEIKN